jgi:hypothetical protein
MGIVRLSVQNPFDAHAAWRMVTVRVFAAIQGDPSARWHALQRHYCLTDAGKMTTQLGTPRGRYDEHSSKFSLSKKPRFVDPVGKSQTKEGDAC